MKRGRPPKYEVKLSELERETLEQLGRSRSEAAGVVRRAQGLLLASEGRANDHIAAQLNVNAATVCYWRKRFSEAGLAGLYDLPKAGRPRTHDDERVAVLLKKALVERPTQATHWSVRQLAAQTGISKSSVQRYFTLFGVQPHRSKSFKLSSDPFFVEKVRDIVGLYLNPPDKALVLCVDEKSQIQALERTQPVLPMGLGYVEGVTHDYYRHGTTTLFAALEVGTGQVITQCKPRHRHQEFLAFLRHLDRNVPASLQLHLIIDNYATHKHPKVRAWLARRPRYHLHFTPTSASWLNQVERWFGRITQQSIRRGSFTTVKQLIQRIEAFVHHYNLHPRPFAWTATADSILGKIERFSKVICGTRH
jgi:putative transposase